MESKFAKYLLGIIAGLALSFILLDVSVWPFDPAYYGEITLQLYYSLRHNTSDFLHQLISAIGFKAPGIAWLGILFVPFSHVTGSIESALLLSVVICGIFAGWFLFISIKNLKELYHFAAFGALLHFVSAPLYFGLLCEYFTEELQLFSVCLIIWAVCNKRGKVVMVSAGFLGLALGMLAKASTPLYILAPALFGLWRLISKEEKIVKTSRLLNGLLCGGAILLCIAAVIWYLHNWEIIKTFIASTSSGSVSELYGHAGEFSDKLFNWLHWTGGAFFTGSYIPKIWLALLVISVLVRIINRKIPFSRFDFFAFLSAVQIAVVLCVFSLQINEETRYLLPSLPYFAVLTAFMLNQFGRVLAGGIFLIFLSQAAIVCGAAFGALWPAPYINSPWLKPIELNSRAKNLLSKVVTTSCSLPKKDHYTIIGVELPWFNANSASFYTAQNMLNDGYRCNYTSLGYAEADAARALARIKEFHAEAVVFLRSFNPQPGKDPFNSVTSNVRNQLAASPEYHLEPIKEFPDLEYYDLIEK